jgi:hypothetical protein
MQQLEFNALRSELADLNFESNSSLESVERLMFKNITWDLLKTPLVALFPTFVVTVERQAIGLIIACSVVLFGLVFLFAYVKEVWQPWNLNRSYMEIGQREVKGEYIVFAAKVITVVIASALVLLAQGSSSQQKPVP